MAKTRTRTPAAPPRTRLHEILDRGRFSETTRKSYRNVLDQWIAYAGPRPSGWTRVAMDSFRSHLVARGMGDESVETYMASLRHVSKWYCAEQGIADFSLIQPVQLAGREPERRHGLSMSQAAQLLSTCSDADSLYDHRDLVMLILGLETGMRRKSLAGARFDKIGTSRGTSATYPSITVPVKGRGGNKTWKVPLSDLALRALGSWEAAVWANGRSPKGGPIFRALGRAGGRVAVSSKGLSEVGIYAVITRRADDAGLECYPHMLRHTFTTWRQDQRVDVIASVTGHKLTNVGEVVTYMDPEIAGEIGRKTTPPELVRIADPLLKRFE
jgi:integrase